MKHHAWKDKGFGFHSVKNKKLFFSRQEINKGDDTDCRMYWKQMKGQEIEKLELFVVICLRRHENSRRASVE